MTEFISRTCDAQEVDDDRDFGAERRLENADRPDAKGIADPDAIGPETPDLGPQCDNGFGDDAAERVGAVLAPDAGELQAIGKIGLVRQDRTEDLPHGDTIGRRCLPEHADRGRRDHLDVVPRSDEGARDIQRAELVPAANVRREDVRDDHHAHRRPSSMCAQTRGQ
jgi:hypothetical protein